MHCFSGIMDEWKRRRKFFRYRTVNSVDKLGLNVYSMCDTYYVVDDVKNLDGREISGEIDYAIDVSNKFNVLCESELEDHKSQKNMEYCLAATAVKNFSNKENWRVRKVGREIFLLLNKSKKPMVIEKNNDTFVSALLDTGSDRCLINYRNVKCLPSDSIKESNVRVRGVNAASRVVGEVQLELNFNEQDKLCTDALILKYA